MLPNSVTVPCFIKFNFAGCLHYACCWLPLLQPLKPKEGRFLPATAALGGLLFLAPEGHLPAQHDVLRLQHDGPSLPIVRQQQGYISCEPKPDVSEL